MVVVVVVFVGVGVMGRNTLRSSPNTGSLRLEKHNKAASGEIGIQFQALLGVDVPRVCLV